MLAPSPEASAQEVSDEALLPEQRLLEERGSLEAVERDLSVSRERQDALKAEVEALDRDRARLTEDLIVTAERIGDLEQSIETTGVRLAALTVDQNRVRQSLESRRSTLTQLLSSLQRIGTKPPPALAVSPDDALGAVRGALLISSVMPEIQREAQALSSDMAELSAIKLDIGEERTALSADLTARAEDQTRLELLIAEKQAASIAQQEALAAEQQRAEELANSANSLKELIALLERDVELSKRAAERAQVALDEGPATPSDFGRLAPAIAFGDAKGQLPLPARGVVLTEFGDIDAATGDPAEGITLATRSGARVISPADGSVVYAGPFRRYGDVLILDAGDAYHLLIAGMDRLDVTIGQFVLSGEPIGEMGERRLASATNLTLESAQPTLYIEIRKEGTPVDPSPWWLRSNDEKESG